MYLRRPQKSSLSLLLVVAKKRKTLSVHSCSVHIQVTRYRSRYSSCRSFRVLSIANGTSSGARSLHLHSLYVSPVVTRSMDPSKWLQQKQYPRTRVVPYLWSDEQVFSLDDAVIKELVESNANLRHALRATITKLPSQLWIEDTNCRVD
jgi:hypothetical protein